MINTLGYLIADRVITVIIIIFILIALYLRIIFDNFLMSFLLSVIYMECKHINYHLPKHNFITHVKYINKEVIVESLLRRLRKFLLAKLMRNSPQNFLPVRLVYIYLALCKCAEPLKIR